MDGKQYVAVAAGRFPDHVQTAIARLAGNGFDLRRQRGICGSMLARRPQRRQPVLQSGAEQIGERIDPGSFRDASQRPVAIDVILIGYRDAHGPAGSRAGPKLFFVRLAQQLEPHAMESELRQASRMATQQSLGVAAAASADSRFSQMDFGPHHRRTAPPRRILRTAPNST